MTENKPSKENLHIAYNRSAVKKENAVRKEFTEDQLRVIAKKNYFDVYPKLKEIFASGYGQFFFSESALKNATKEESTGFLRIGIKRP